MPFGFYSKGTIIIPPMPKWPEGPTQRVTVADLQIAVQRHSPACRLGTQKDAEFIAVPAGILQPAILWTLRSLQAQGIVYTPESWDCENFVNEADQTLRKMAALAGLKASPLTCCISAVLTAEWANAKPGGAHALMGTMTDRGLWISESQNGQTCAIELYPNRSTLTLADNF